MHDYLHSCQPAWRGSAAAGITRAAATAAARMEHFATLLSGCGAALVRVLAFGWATALALAVPAHASDVAPLTPAALAQPAVAASWASRALMLSVARASSGLVAVGEHGFVLLSGDEGRSWTQVPDVPTSVTLTRVRFASATAGWAVGHMGVVLHTVDAGRHWTRVSDGAASARLALQRAEAMAPAVAYPSGDAEALRATARQLVGDGPDKPLLALLASKPGSMLALGAFGTGLRMAGEPAQPASLIDRLANPGALHVYGLAESAGAVYAVGEQGLLLKAQDGGPFSTLSAPYKGTYFGVLALPEGELLVYGLRGTILRSTDAGKSWVQVDCGSQQSITSAVVLADGTVLLGSQGGQLLRSSDRGRSFSLSGQAPQPVADLLQAADGAIVVAGPRGMMRVESVKRAGTI